MLRRPFLGFIGAVLFGGAALAQPADTARPVPAADGEAQVGEWQRRLSCHGLLGTSRRSLEAALVSTPQIAERVQPQIVTHVV